MQDKKNINIAILSSFTIRGIEEGLCLKCQEIGVAPNIYTGGYNQYAQEIINPDSGLYQFNSDLVFIFIDTRALMGEYFFSPYQVSEIQRREWVNEKITEIKLFVQQLESRLSAKIVIHNFEVPTHSPLGVLENKQGFGFQESIETLNGLLRDAYKNDSQVFVFDYDAFCSRIGKENIFDHKMYYLGDIKLGLSHIPKLCDEYLAYIKPLMSLNKKCIVLDLDNILWGGVIGEEGLEGIKLGPTSEGRPFWEFQKHLLSLFQRGVILAINSKNNPEDALRVFHEHPHMILKEEHFAAMRMNWDDKVANMKSLAEEINIGLDNLVFIDDDKLNREIIRGMLPEVTVVEMPDDPALYAKTLLELNEFQILQLTDEDLQKGKMYAAEKQRRDFQQVATDLTDYLKGLAMIIEIENANKMNIPRLAQLTQKTNQFNMTTRRYTEEDIEKMLASGEFLIISIKVEDKFGDNGIVGAAIVEKNIDNKWRINTFLLSCRIIGRRIEETLLAYIIEEAKKAGAKFLSGDFISTKKNHPAKDFYKKNNFKLVKSENKTGLWEFDLTNNYPFPEFITIKNEKL
ncbi:MAG: HAD-IIIC family phosphatase [bacterium]|nr:HAD-IIIC family phosphatase [bacterium]